MTLKGQTPPSTRKREAARVIDRKAELEAIITAEGSFLAPVANASAFVAGKMVREVNAMLAGWSDIECPPSRRTAIRAALELRDKLKAERKATAS